MYYLYYMIQTETTETMTNTQGFKLLIDGKELYTRYQDIIQTEKQSAGWNLFEYYLNRKGKYYFRSPASGIIVVESDELKKIMSKYKYGEKFKMEIG